MDVAQGAQVAAAVEEKIGPIQQAYQAAEEAVQGLDWTGEDADRYKSEFSSQVGDAVQTLVQAFQQRAQELNEDVQQQTQVSSQ